MQSASVLLRMLLELVLNLGLRGFARGYDPGNVSQTLGPARLVSSVAEILSYFVVTSEANAWLVTQLEHLDKIPKGVPWNMRQQAMATRR